SNNKVLPVVTNVALEAGIKSLFDQTMAEFGAVHLLFNNAGVGGGGNAWTATQKDWDWVLGVNLHSVIFGLRHFIPQMLAQNEPCHIVNTASVAGLLGGTTNALYSVTKHGVVALTENLFNDLKAVTDQVHCSVLCPGFVNTNIFDSGRNRPADLANDGPEPIRSKEDEERIAAFREILKQGLQPAQLADIVFDSIRAERLYILTHPDFNELIRVRAGNITSGTNPAPMGF
ncbi:MAG: SDR family NAD(P)-dependent oxidoreductase, partial [Pseudomonadales bacterium]|nr:SDR family NAD(P)-dependent oxidoreductase [Pseudomonadales bacterium]